MLCDKCKKNEASVHIRKVSKNGEVQAMNLCPPCAMREFLENARMFGGHEDAESFDAGLANEALRQMMEGALPPNLQEQFGRLLDGKLDNIVGASTKKCKACGATLDSVMRKGMLDCPECLNAFRQELRKEFSPSNPHGRLSAAGASVASDLNEESRLWMTLNEAKNRLSALSTQEKYEEAAAVKKEIRLLEVQLQEAHAKAEKLLSLSREKDEDGADATVSSKRRTASRAKLNDKIPLWCSTKNARSTKPEIILSSNLVMGRNLREFSFADDGGNAKQMQTLCSFLLKVLKEQPEFAEALIFSHWDKMSEDVREHLLHLHWGCASAMQIRHPSALLVNAGAGVKAMINFCDHLTISMWGNATGLPGLKERMLKIEENLNGRLQFVQDEEFGMISRFPAMMGHGMSPSMVLHIPALMLFDNMESIREAMHQVGMCIEPFYMRREVLAPQMSVIGCGAFYIVSVENGTRHSLDECVSMVQHWALVLEQRELQKRQEICSNGRLRLRCCDLVGKALGLIEHGTLMTITECREALSTLWFGIELDILPDLRQNLRNESLKILFADMRNTGDEYDNPAITHDKIVALCNYNMLLVKQRLGIGDDVFESGAVRRGKKN